MKRRTIAARAATRPPAALTKQAHVEHAGLPPVRHVYRGGWRGTTETLIVGGLALGTLLHIHVLYLTLSALAR